MSLFQHGSNLQGVHYYNIVVPKAIVLCISINLSNNWERIQQINFMFINIEIHNKKGYDEIVVNISTLIDQSFSCDIKGNQINLEGHIFYCINNKNLKMFFLNVTTQVSFYQQGENS